MAHCKNYKMSEVASLQGEWERLNEHNKNERIDKSLSKNNYDLIDRHGKSIYQALKNRLYDVDGNPKLYMYGSKKLNHYSSWVIQLPKEYCNETVSNYIDKDGKTVEYVRNIPMNNDKSKEFFTAVKDFFASRYGSENILNACVHMDETTPHMHLGMVPVVEIERKKNGKKYKTMSLSPTKLFDRQEMRDFHPLLDEYLKQNLEWYHGGILNGKTYGVRDVETIKYNGKQFDSINKTVDLIHENLTAIEKEIQNSDADLMFLGQFGKPKKFGDGYTITKEEHDNIVNMSIELRKRRAMDNVNDSLHDLVRLEHGSHVATEFSKIEKENIKLNNQIDYKNQEINKYKSINESLNKKNNDLTSLLTYTCNVIYDLYDNLVADAKQQLKAPQSEMDQGAWGRKWNTFLGMVGGINLYKRGVYPQEKPTVINKFADLTAKLGWDTAKEQTVVDDTNELIDEKIYLKEMQNQNEYEYDDGIEL